jgi:hypothetical protein
MGHHLPEELAGIVGDPHPRVYAAVVLVFLVLALAFGSILPAAPGRVAFVRNGKLRILYLATGEENVVQEHAPHGPVAFSGNGKLASAGGQVAGGPSLPAGSLAWSPTGETAAYTTRSGAVVLWTPLRHRTIVPAAWGATSLAWGPGGQLALGRSDCHVPCGVPLHQEVWIWRAGSFRRVAGPLKGVQRPIVTGFSPDGRVLWWSDLEGSASIAADGLPLYANRTRLAVTLPYPDFVASCGAHLVISAGIDRYAMHGKRLLLDGREVSRDSKRSWVEPACSADGQTLVAAASRNAVPNRIGNEHRAIWQLLPTRRQLTRPPLGATDEDPRLLANGSLIFVRTRKLETRLSLYGRGTLMLLRDGKLTRLADVGRTGNYYGHYGWRGQIALWL